MNYTLEKKREALARGELWWRFPGADDASDAAWTNEADMSVRSPVAEYFIGPTPPRVLSELEGELLEALKHCEDMLMRYGLNRVDGEAIEDAALTKIRAAIQKAEAQQ